MLQGMEACLADSKSHVQQVAVDCRKLRATSRRGSRPCGPSRSNGWNAAAFLQQRNWVLLERGAALRQQREQRLLELGAALRQRHEQKLLELVAAFRQQHEQVPG